MNYNRDAIIVMLYSEFVSICTVYYIISSRAEFNKIHVSNLVKWGSFWPMVEFDASLGPDRFDLIAKTYISAI
jgi:hypothetical protein